MIIGIDGNEANVEKRVGVNEYAFQILWNLRKLQENGECRDNLIVYVKEKPLGDLPKETQNFKYKVLPGGGFWILIKLTPYLFRNPDKIDILFSPSHYTVPFSAVPRVCSIMDLGYLKYTEHFEKKVFWQLKWWTAISIFVSKRVIAISNSTKNDIVRHYPFARKKTYVTHLGYDGKRFNTNISDEDVRRIKNRYSIVDDYILCLGTLKPSKNIEGLIEAFSRISGGARSRFAGQLVIAGKKGWLYKSIYEKAEKLGLSSKIVFTDFIPDIDRPSLMAGARLYVQTSFWEGFGIEVVNAMATGIPVVVSNTGSVPEVVGDAGVLVDPYGVESIAHGIKKVLSMPKAGYNKLVEKGLVQAKKFSWENCARQTLKILQNVQKQNR